MRVAVLIFLTAWSAIFQAQAHEPAGRMKSAAQSFVATLSDAQRAAVTRPFDDQAARTQWSNLPTTMAPRAGLPLMALSDVQRVALHRLLSSALSSQGYGKAATIMWLDDILRGMEEESYRDMPRAQQQQRAEVLLSRDSGNYWLMLFGRPDDARWGFMLTGHHLAVNFTVVDGRVAFTPLFVGANPQTVRQGRYAGWRVLDQEIDRAFALMASLDSAQRAAAVQADTMTVDLLTGPGRKDSLKAPVGLAASRLDRTQSDLLWRLVEEFVGNAAPETAADQLASIRRDGLGRLYLAWWGSTSDPAQRFFARIQGPSILIEYTREPDAAGGPANHVHAIVRDPRNDYGEQWLEQHYREAHRE